jgi:flagellar motor switch protein FliM
MVGGEQGENTGGEKAQSSNSSPRHEFPSVSSLSTVELRKLRMRHENFLQTLSARLSLHFRLECNLQMLKLETAPFRLFVDSLNNPTHLCLFKLEPFRGVSFLDIPLRMAMCVIDRELGGPGRAAEEARELSKMEARLLNRVVDIMVAEWCQEWSDMAELRPAMIRSENNGRFLQTHQPHTPMLVLGVEVRLGALVEQMHFAFPCRSLEPILVKLNSDPDADNADEPDRASNRPVPWNQAFYDIGIKVTAELPDVEITARQLGDLKPGDFIPVSAANASQIQVYLESQPKFVGNLGVAGDQLAVQISKIVKN